MTRDLHNRKNIISRICIQCNIEFLVPVKDVKGGRGLYCGKKCYDNSRVVPMDVKFWRNVQKTDNCWIWTGGGSRGYGHISRGRGRGQIGAHKLSWEIHYGAVLDGFIVCHECDNPSCVRPDHLFIGTYLDNTEDMIRKGRARVPNIRVRYGESVGTSKLTKAIVIEARRRHEQEKTSCRRLAIEYGVGPTTMGRVLKYETWRHVTDL